MIWETWIVVTLSRTLAYGTPLLLGTLGEIYAERSGVLNLGVEGMMIMGAYSAFATAYTTGSPWLGILVAGARRRGLLPRSRLREHHPEGKSGRLRPVSHHARPRPRRCAGRGWEGKPLPVPSGAIRVPGLSAIPGPGADPVRGAEPDRLHSAPPRSLLWYVLYRTRIGITIRSVGRTRARPIPWA